MYKSPRGRFQGPYCGGWGSRCIKDLIALLGPLPPLQNLSEIKRKLVPYINASPVHKTPNTGKLFMDIKHLCVCNRVDLVRRHVCLFQSFSEHSQHVLPVKPGIIWDGFQLLDLANGRPCVAKLVRRAVTLVREVAKLARWVVKLVKWAVKLVSWVAKLVRWAVKLVKWVAKLVRLGAKLVRLGAKLVRLGAKFVSWAVKMARWVATFVRWVAKLWDGWQNLWDGWLSWWKGWLKNGA